jgi:hypothetical protein
MMARPSSDVAVNKVKAFPRTLTIHKQPHCDKAL